MNDLTEVQSAVQRAVTVLVDVIQRGVGGELGIRVELPTAILPLSALKEPAEPIRPPVPRISEFVWASST